MTVSIPSFLLPAEPPLAHVDALPAGTRLAEFELQSLLGVGGFGMVYRAYDHTLHRTVAIKEYMPSALAGRQAGQTVAVRSSADQQSYQSGLNSFVAEARLLAQFDHPSLVKVYRFWEANNTAYMVMPLYSGVTLKQARSQMAGPPSEAWLRTVLWSILQALQLLHENQTLHRDVSPDNIFLQDMGPPVLLDLGAARRAISGHSQKYTAILKVNYAPIEQYADAEGLKPGPWSDLYSLAAVVHGCLRNAPPLAATARVVRDSMPPLASVVQTVQAYFGQSYSEAFVRAIAHALVIPPSERPQSVSALVQEMQLGAPAALATFDWRAELEAMLLPAAGEFSPSQWRTQPQTVAEHGDPQQAANLQDVTTVRMAAALPDLDVSQGGPQSRLPEGQGQVATPARRPAWLKVWLAAAVPLGVAGLAFLSLRSPGEPAPLVAAPEAATSPAVVPRAPPEPVRAASPPKPKAVAVARQVDKAPAVNKTDPVDQAPAPRKDKPAPAKPARAPIELCPDSNFFTRPMCIHLECKKPEYAGLAVCVEDRQRYPDN